VRATPAVLELRNQAKTAFRDGDYEKASRLYKQLTEINPPQLSVLKESMWALWNMGRAELSIEVAKTVLTLVPDDPEATKIISWGPSALNKQRVLKLKRRQ
jgi:Flp pilus assembly protein TadD